MKSYNYDIGFFSAKPEVHTGIYFDGSEKSSAYLSSYLTRLDLHCVTGKPCGNICIPAHFHCRKKASVGVSNENVRPNKSNPVNKKAISEKLKQIEDHIRLNAFHEDMVGLDSQGQVIANIKGGAMSVNIPYDVAAKLNGGILTHNHPTWRYYPNDPRVEGRSFSYPDINAAALMNLKEIRAVAPGYTYSLKPSEKGWQRGAVKLNYTKNAVLTHVDLTKRVRSGEKTAQQAESEFQGEIIKRMSEDLGWKYSEVKRNRSRAERQNSLRLIRKHGALSLPSSAQTAEMMVSDVASDGLGLLLKGAFLTAVAAKIYRRATKKQNFSQTASFSETSLSPVRKPRLRRRRLAV